MAKLDLALVVRTVDRATQPLQRVQRTLRRVGEAARRVGRQAAELGRRVGLAMAAAGAGAAIAIKQFTSYGDRLAKTADRIGITVEELQRLRFAFQIGGAEIEQADKSLEYFNRRIGESARGTGEAYEVFRAMGISLTEQGGGAKTVRSLLDEVAAKFREQADAAKVAYAANILFGRSGKEFINALSAGPESLRRLGDEAERFGLLSEEGARESEQFVDEMLRLRTAMVGIGNAIAEQILPHLTPFVTQMGEFISENKVEIVDRILSGFDKLADTMGVLKIVAIALAAAVSAKLLAVFVSPLGAVALAAAGLYLIWDNWEEIVDWIETKLMHLVEFFRQKWEAIKSFFTFDWFIGDNAGSEIGGPGPGGPSGGVFELPPIRVEGDRPGGKAEVTVDFRNMPAGTRTEMRADSDVDLEVTTGFAMQGAQ